MRRETALLDRFRLAAAVLVVCIHTSPLASFTAMGDFWLTRVLARVAVPFFLMTTGYFLGRRDWKGLSRQWKKLGLLYLAAVSHRPGGRQLLWPCLPASGGGGILRRSLCRVRLQPLRAVLCTPFPAPGGRGAPVAYQGVEPETLQAHPC